MGQATNFILVVLGFCSLSAGIFLYKKRTLFISFLALGLVFLVSPFALNLYLTRSAHPWTIVVQREIDSSREPRVFFLQKIEWITDYEQLGGRRGHVGSLLLDEDLTRKEWRVKGYIPISIEAFILYGSDEYSIFRSLDGLEAGSYTFTLSFDVNDSGTWSIEKTDMTGGEEE